MCSQGTSQFYLHTPRSSANGMNHTCLWLPSRSWYWFTCNHNIALLPILSSVFCLCSFVGVRLLSMHSSETQVLWLLHETSDNVNRVTVYRNWMNSLRPKYCDCCMKLVITWTVLQCIATGWTAWVCRRSYIISTTTLPAAWSSFSYMTSLDRALSTGQESRRSFTACGWWWKKSVCDSCCSPLSVD